jgi:hypothetical protein
MIHFARSKCRSNRPHCQAKGGHNRVTVLTSPRTTWLNLMISGAGSSAFALATQALTTSVRATRTSATCGSTGNNKMNMQNNKPAPKKPSEMTQRELIIAVTPLPAPLWICMLGHAFYFVVIVCFSAWALMPRH